MSGLSKVYLRKREKAEQQKQLGVLALVTLTGCGYTAHTGFKNNPIHAIQVDNYVKLW